MLSIEKILEVRPGENSMQEKKKILSWVESGREIGRKCIFTLLIISALKTMIKLLFLKCNRAKK